MVVSIIDDSGASHQVDYTTCDDVSFSITTEPSDMLTHTGTTGELSVVGGLTDHVLFKVTFTVSIGDLWTSN